MLLFFRLFSLLHVQPNNVEMIEYGRLVMDGELKVKSDGDSSQSMRYACAPFTDFFIKFVRENISQIYGASLAIWGHTANATCHRPQLNALRLNPS